MGALGTTDLIVLLAAALLLFGPCRPRGPLAAGTARGTSTAPIGRPPRDHRAGAIRRERSKEPRS